MNARRPMLPGKSARRFFETIDVPHQRKDSLRSDGRWWARQIWKSNICQTCYFWSFLCQAHTSLSTCIITIAGAQIRLVGLKNARAPAKLRPPELSDAQLYCLLLKHQTGIKPVIFWSPVRRFDSRLGLRDIFHSLRLSLSSKQFTYHASTCSN